MKLNTEYVILILTYVFVLAILYSYKQTTEGFNDATDFLTSNDFVVVTLMAVMAGFIIMILYRVL